MTTIDRPSQVRLAAVAARTQHPRRDSDRRRNGSVAVCRVAVVRSLGFSTSSTDLNIRSTVFIVFAAATFLILYGSFLALKPSAFASGTVMINGQPVQLPLEPVIRVAAIALSVVIAGGTAIGMASQWATLALYWYGSPAALGSAAAPAAVVDPIFARPLAFYFFTLPAWRLIAGWATTLAVIVFFASIFFAVITGGARLLERRPRATSTLPLRGVSASFAVVLAMAFRVPGPTDRIYATTVFRRFLHRAFPSPGFDCGVRRDRAYRRWPTR